MSLVAKLIGFGFRQALGAGAGQAAEIVVGIVEKHFADHSQTLPKALAKANNRAWQSLSIALAGDGFLDKIKVFFASGDDKGIREQVQLFLRDKNIGFEGTSADFRKQCLIELKTAKQAGLLTVPNPLVPKDVARQTASFQRYAGPKGMMDGAEQVMAQIADDLASEYPNLAKLLRKRTAGGPPLLVSAFAFFFRREVETNDELAHGLFFDGLRQLSASQAKAFGEINKALISLGDQFERVFEQLDRIETVVVETQSVVVETHGAVLVNEQPVAPSTSVSSGKVPAQSPRPPHKDQTPRALDEQQSRANVAMTMQFNCPTCKKPLKAPDEKAGGKVSCPGCKAVFQVPHRVAPGVAAKQIAISQANPFATGLNLAAFAIRPLVGYACTALGIPGKDILANGIGKVVEFLGDKFNNESQRLTLALNNANNKAWTTLELALEGESLWNRLTAKGDDSHFAQQIRTFLDFVEKSPDFEGKPDFRQRCLEEIRAARKKGLLTGTVNDTSPLAQISGVFATYADPVAMLNAEWNFVGQLANAIEKQGYKNLASLLRQKPTQGMPLLIVGVRYYFGRAVEEDDKLFRGIAYAKLEALGEAQEKGFAALFDAFVAKGQRLDGLLVDMSGDVGEIKAGVKKLDSVPDDVRRMRDEVRRIADAVNALEKRLGTQDEVKPGHRDRIWTPEERVAVKQLLAQFLQLTDAEQKQFTALLNGLGRLQNGIGDFGEARKCFDRAIADATEAIRLDPKFAEAYATRAEAYRMNDDFDRAIADATEAIRLDPKFAVAYRTRAIAYLGKKDFDRAIADATEAIRLDPKFAVAYRTRAIAYLGKKDFDRAIADATDAIRLDLKYTQAYGIRAHAYLGKNDFDRAIADATEAIHLDPKFAFTYGIRAEAYRGNDDLDLAIADATEAIRLDPKYHEAYGIRAEAYLEKNDFDLAIADATEAIRLEPKYHEAYGTRAEAYRMNDDFDRAIADATEAIRLDPKFARDYFSRAEANWMNDDFDRAIADATEAIRLDPKFALAYGTRADAYRMNDDFDRAIADATEAIRLDPKYAFAYRIRAEAYRMNDDFDRAIADATEAIRLDPKFAFTYFSRAESYRCKNDFDRAIADANEAIRIDPTFARDYFSRAESYRCKNDFDRAIADANEAIRLDPTFAWAYGTRADAYLGKNDFDRAIADATEAIRLDPKDVWAYHIRADAYRWKKDYDRAVADATEAIRLDPKDAWAYRIRADAYRWKKDYDRAIADATEAIRIDPKDAHAYR